MAKKAETIKQYIQEKPKATHALLNDMYACLKQVAPKAEEGLKWGMPAFTQGKILFTFAAFKQHLSLVPTPAVVEVFSRDLEKFTVTKAAIHFPLDKPLPKTLVKKIARYRLKEVVEKGAKWM